METASQPKTSPGAALERALTSRIVGDIVRISRTRTGGQNGAGARYPTLIRRISAGAARPQYLRRRNPYEPTIIKSLGGFPYSDPAFCKCQPASYPGQCECPATKGRRCDDSASGRRVSFKIVSRVSRRTAWNDSGRCP